MKSGLIDSQDSDQIAGEDGNNDRPEWRASFVHPAHSQISALQTVQAAVNHFVTYTQSFFVLIMFIVFIRLVNSHETTHLGYRPTASSLVIGHCECSH